MKNTNIRAVAGVRNDVPPERFSTGDLVSGVNVDIDETGKVSRRFGMRRVISGTDVHSLWVDGDGDGDDPSQGFYVDGSNLYFLTKGLVASVAMTGLTPGRRMSYVETARRIYFSNGVDAGVVTGQVITPLGIAVPPVLTVSNILGNLPAGIYGATLTYVRAGGQESGAPANAYVNLATKGGIHFSALPVSNDPAVTTKNLYITARNGEVPFLVASMPNSAATFDYTDIADGMLPCITQFHSPLPPGHVLGYYNGRLYSMSGNIIWYSDVYNYELCDMRESYIQLDARGTIFAPVAAEGFMGAGIFVGSESETVFFKGADPSEFARIPATSAASIFGTLSYIDPRFAGKDGGKGPIPMWATARGIVFGNAAGQFTEVTSDRYVLPAVTSGASLHRLKTGTSHFLTVFNQ